MYAIFSRSVLVVHTRLLAIYLVHNQIPLFAEYVVLLHEDGIVNVLHAASEFGHVGQKQQFLVFVGGFALVVGDAFLNLPALAPLGAL